MHGHGRVNGVHDEWTSMEPTPFTVPGFVFETLRSWLLICQLGWLGTDRN